MTTHQLAAPTREQCIREAAEAFAEARRHRDTRPLEEAVRAAWTPTGPPLDELRHRLAARRARTAAVSA